MNEAVKPKGCTNLRLRHLGRLVGRRYDAEMAASGMKASQYSLLSHVMHLGPLRPMDLALALGIDASTLTRNLKTVIDAGWIEQSPGADARSRSISITAAGRAKRAEGQRHWRRAQESLTALLGTDRVLALHALLDESIGLLEAADLDEPAAIDG